MTNNGPSDTTLRDVYRALFRHRGKALLFFIAVMAATVLATVLMPRAYLSESKLFVRLGRENVTLDPTVTLGNDPVVVAPLAREDEMNSVAAMLGSRAMLERVVDTVGPEVVLQEEPGAVPLPEVQHAGVAAMPETADGRARELASAASATARRSLLGEELPSRERALRHISRRLKVEPVRRSNILEIAYEGPTPELAQKIVATLIDSYLEEHARLNRVPGSHRFFAEQAERLGNKLAKLEEELSELKAQTGLASIDDQRIQIITRAGRLEDELLQAESSRAEVEARVLSLREKLADLPKERVAETTEGVNDSGTDGIRQQFFGSSD